MAAIRGAIVDVLAEEHPATVRQVFYALVGRGVISKTEAEYKGTVVRLLGEMRPVTEEQIRDLRLPSRPTKRSDTRASGFVGDSVEVDAIPPTPLRQMAMDCIRGHVDEVALELLEAVEAEERGIFEGLARHFARAG